MSKGRERLKAEQTRALNIAYDNLIKEIARIFNKNTISEEEIFRLDNQNSNQKRRATQAFREYRKELSKILSESQIKAWELAQTENKKAVISYIERLVTASTPLYIKPKDLDFSKQLKDFQNRTFRVGTISDRVWDIQDLAKENIEIALTEALAKGKSAQQLAMEIKRHLRNPDALYRRVRNSKGRLVPSRNMKAYKPGQGVYKSAHQNALRLARTEINLAYGRSEQLYIDNSTDIVGVNINTSRTGKNICETCTALAGTYPAWFKWAIWHINCYHKETKVFTEKGWVYMKDVKVGDMVWSMNPDTRELELVQTIRTFKRKHEGNLINFNNKFLSLVVTPDHKMVYKNQKGEFKDDMIAEDFNVGKALYRTAKWIKKDTENININGLEFKFDDYCEFMAYWLADGSLIRNSQIRLARQNSERNKDIREKIKNVINRLGFEATMSDCSISLYSKELNAYLKQFGTAIYKYVPQEIKNASKRQIDIFLQGYVETDGYTPKLKSFVGSRGTVCNPKRKARRFFTSSERMMNDLCELIMKMDRKPYFTVNSKKGTTYNFPNGEYKTNADNYIISEAFSKTATVFNKNEVPYNDYVYDIELERNHTLYVSMDGKAVWGSNCKCHRTYILKTDAEFREEMKTGKVLPIEKSKNYIKDLPSNFIEWESENRETISRRKHKPMFLSENGF